FEVAGQHEGADLASEEGPRSVRDPGRDPVAFTRRVVDVPGADRRMTGEAGRGSRGDRLGGLAGDRRARGDRLEATPLTAGAQLPVGIHDDMADLAGRTPRTAIETPVEHETRPDAGAAGNVC